MIKVAFPIAAPQSACVNTPTVVYTLINPIGSKIFNFDKFVNNLDVKVFFDDICECTVSLFVDKDDNRFITSN